MKITNGLKMTHLATGYPETIALNAVEMKFLFDKNPSTLNDSWDLLCESVYDRLGIRIQGEFEVDNILIDGTSLEFH